MKTSIVYYLSIILIFGLGSCNKETIIVDDPVIIVDPPTEIDYPVAKGIVTNEIEPIENTLVSVYQDGELKGTTKTDENGAFSTIEIETEEGDDIFLVFQNELYNIAYRKRSGEELTLSTLNVQLTNPENDLANDIIDNLDSDDHISLSGNIVDFLGDPGDALIAAEYEIDNINYYNYTKSDNLGYYELIVGKDALLYVYILGKNGDCAEYLTEEEIELTSGAKAEVMGPYQDDVVFDDYVVSLLNNELEISGQVKQCDGSASIVSEIQITIKDSGNRNQVYVFEGESDGTFTFSDDECMIFPYTIEVVGMDLANNMHSDTLFMEITESGYSTNLLELRACTISEVGFSTVTMNLDGIDYNFDQINVRLENGDVISDDQSTLSFALFTIPDIQQGSNDIIGLELGNWISGVYFKAVNSVMNANVTSLTANTAEVEVFGDFQDINGDVVQGTCTLSLKF
ncbi:MAG: hypothetical protein P1U56_14965 [Saprospiraceae bacterium]|nr:hypothetical protein [Saprospiraceae bacterium]